MSKDYLNQFTNKNLEKLVAGKTSILDSIINIYSDMYIHSDLHKMYSELVESPYIKNKSSATNPILNKSELEDTFVEVKKEVDSFLGISNITTPSFGYFGLFNRISLANISITGLYTNSANFLYGLHGLISDFRLAYEYGVIQNISSGNALLVLWGGISFYLGHRLHSSLSHGSYNSLEKLINLPKDRRTIIIPIMAHEYAHHVLRECLGLKCGHKIFSEGFAKGVAKYIAGLYGEREENVAFIDEILVDTLYSCIKYKSLQNKKNKQDAHTVGRILFQIWEFEKGKSIYNDIIHKRFTPV